ncbi:hypothetical protein BX667DRAFT_186478 [Coemansia mojavensis]|nr:hypothetical protein BX667DRAFT_186478 [Coemansia mojavensis]
MVTAYRVPSPKALNAQPTWLVVIISPAFCACLCARRCPSATAAKSDPANPIPATDRNIRFSCCCLSYSACLRGLSLIFQQFDFSKQNS